MQNVFMRRNSLTGVHNTKGGRNRCMTGMSTSNRYDYFYSIVVCAFQAWPCIWELPPPVEDFGATNGSASKWQKNTYQLLRSTACLIKASNLPSSTCHKTQCHTRLYILGNYSQNQNINMCWPVTSGWCNELFNNNYISGYLSPVATLTCTFILWLFIVEWMWHRHRWCCLTCITLTFYYFFNCDDAKCGYKLLSAYTLQGLRKRFTHKFSTERGSALFYDSICRYGLLPPNIFSFCWVGDQVTHFVPHTHSLHSYSFWSQLERNVFLALNCSMANTQGCLCYLYNVHFLFWIMKLFLEPNRQIHSDSETKRFTVHVHVSQKKENKRRSS